MSDFKRDFNSRKKIDLALKKLAEIMYDQYIKELQNERSVIEPDLKIFNKNK